MLNNEGVSTTLENIIAFMIAFVLFGILMLMSANIFIDAPGRAVSSVQFTDIGNDITAKLVDTYLIAPDNGTVSTTFYIPMTVAGKDYISNIRDTSNGQDKEVVVYSPYNSVSIAVTINGVNSTIPVNGTTSSLTPTHRIYYMK
ncbi:DUF7266 family protein [Methanocella conradii]|uniref:DUF7266 family protein n=1 Tax=Methanocella conradii TaxID=1175444 RepID=UPI0024B3BD8E|nr:hypothetical protein [Methanocella conradii]MDI6896747.1 hypothetical protein [Methanocella conradii]